MRFGIIGAGYIGPINTWALMECKDAEIAAVANRTEAKAKKLCEDLGLKCPTYSDWREMLDREKPETVVLNIYNDLHREYFLECVSRGMNVLLEKPVANTYEECVEMMEAAKKAGVKVSVLQTQRYNCVFHTAMDYIRKNKEKLGELVTITDVLCCNYFWDGRSPWHLDPVRSGGGIVMNYGVHQLDRIHYFLGQKTVRFDAQYQVKKDGIETFSSYTMFGVGDKGTPYTATCTGNSGPGVNEINLIFQNGIVRCNLGGNGMENFGTFAGNNSTGIFVELPQLCSNGVNHHDAYVREFTEAVDYLMGRRPDAPVPLEWGAEMVRLCNLGFGK